MAKPTPPARPAGSRNKAIPAASPGRTPKAAPARPKLVHALRTVRAHSRLSLAALVGGLLFAGLSLLTDWSPILRLEVAWDTGTLLFLVICLVMMREDSAPEQMQRYAQIHDEGRWAVLMTSVTATVTSLVVIAYGLSTAKDLAMPGKALSIALAGLTLVLSWLFLHTVFALHYAHDFYGDCDPDGPGPMAARRHGGLLFPDTEAPNYVDFLYFSLVIGMTFQVSDVQITRRGLRALTLAHSVMAFFFNTVILALTINILASLI